MIQVVFIFRICFHTNPTISQVAVFWLYKKLLARKQAQH